MIKKVRGTFLTLALKYESEAGSGDLFDANFVRSISPPSTVSQTVEALALKCESGQFHWIYEISVLGLMFSM